MEAQHVRLGAGEVTLEGDLTIPTQPKGLVIFAHGSGSSRHSPRNRQVAGVLQNAGLATLLMDLLTRSEEQLDLRTAALRFDIELLAGRLTHAVNWASTRPEISGLAIGLFGSSTGAAAALIAAADEPDRVRAVVSRGGRPDLAAPVLHKVRAPTLLIVGGDDEPVIGLNEQAKAQMTCPVRLEIVPGASHLFEEPGALEAVSRLASEWFVDHLG